MNWHLGIEQQRRRVIRMSALGHHEASLDACQRQSSGGVLAANDGGHSVSATQGDIDLFPSDLLSREFAQRDEESHAHVWWLGHTRTRQEKAVAAALLSRHVPYYVPLVTR